MIVKLDAISQAMINLQAVDGFIQPPQQQGLPRQIRVEVGRHNPGALTAPPAAKSSGNMRSIRPLPSSNKGPKSSGFIICQRLAARTVGKVGS